MATQEFKRKLAAILSADVAGYSRLMGEDEAATVRTLETYKGVISELIQRHRGRVVDAPGDNLLAEFASVVDAVLCAVAAQKEIQARNLELPGGRIMQFRIGINLGDVIEEEGRIYGDGVNIAARLESLAEPGGICVSKSAFDHIENKLPLGYEYLGEQTVKNIAKPVGAYKVLMEPRITLKPPSPTKPKEGTKHKYKFIALVSVLIMAVAALVVWRFAFPPAEPMVERNRNGKEVKKNTKPADCTDLKVEIFNKIPFYMTTTIDKGRPDILYYARLVGTNKCENTLQIKVKFTVRNPDFARIKEEPDFARIKEEREDGGEVDWQKKERGWLRFTVAKNETIDRNLHPKFEFMRPAFNNEIINVEYHIRTLNNEDIRYDDLGEIAITAKDLVYWDLTAPSGVNVSPKFLLASLSAWWAVKDKALEDQARKYLVRKGSSSSLEWFKRCYTDLFDRSQGSSLVKVNPYCESWPLAGKGEGSKQRLCKPTEVVTGKVHEIHSLEAALLLAALVNNLKENLVSHIELWAVPDPQEGNAGTKRFLISWSPDGRNWYALDMTDPNKLAFRVNESEATAMIRNLHQYRGDIISSLKESGVFIEDNQFVLRGRQFLALDFSRASDCFNISALP